MRVDDLFGRRHIGIFFLAEVFSLLGNLLVERVNQIIRQFRNRARRFTDVSVGFHYVGDAI